MFSVLKMMSMDIKKELKNMKGVWNSERNKIAFPSITKHRDTL
jgi:hypothetical protein